jgi:hypothetical protein
LYVKTTEPSDITELGSPRYIYWHIIKIPSSFSPIILFIIPKIVTFIMLTADMTLENRWNQNILEGRNSTHKLLKWHEKKNAVRELKYRQKLLEICSLSLTIKNRF